MNKRGYENESGGVMPPKKRMITSVEDLPDDVEWVAENGYYPDGLDEHCYGDDADVQRLMSMPEVQREKELERRHERRVLLREQVEFRSQLRRPGQRDDPTSRLSSRSAALADLASRRQQNRRASGPLDYGSGVSPSTRGGKDATTAAERKKTLPFPTLQEVLPAVLKRDDMLRHNWFEHPDFASGVEGCLVRVNLGPLRARPDEPTYRLARVSRLEYRNPEYDLVGPGSAAKRSRAYLICAIAGSEKPMPLSSVSNQEPTERDLTRFCEACVEKNRHGDIPKRSELQQSARFVQSLRESMPQYEEAHVARVIAAQGSKTVMQQLMELNEKLRIARDANDPEQVRFLQGRIDALRNAIPQNTSVARKPRSMAQGALRSEPEIVLDVEAAAKRLGAAGQEANPFMRVETLPTMVFADPSAKDSKDEETAVANEPDLRVEEVPLPEADATKAFQVSQRLNEVFRELHLPLATGMLASSDFDKASSISAAWAAVGVTPRSYFTKDRFVRGGSGRILSLDDYVQQLNQMG